MTKMILVSDAAHAELKKRKAETHTKIGKQIDALLNIQEVKPSQPISQTTPLPQ